MLETVHHQIELNKPDGGTNHSGRYRTKPKVKDSKKQEIGQMLHMEVIESVLSECLSPIYMNQKGWQFRFFVYYRKLNSVTICDLYWIPRLKKYIDFPGDATILSALDAK